ncbi:hypothetical protein EI94DRAFT_1709256 [Lactarius quietus]|nr:hypothetical protein EI94DRAFT_1709256 [Lactarius quietus]
MATSVYANQVSAGGHPVAHVYGRTFPPQSPLSAKSIEEPRHKERPSIELKFSSSGAKIINAVVVDLAGHPLYSVTSNTKRTKFLSHRDNSEVANVNWNRSSPRMVFRGKKVKCKEWLARAGPETEFRSFVHGDSQFTWMQQSSCGFLIPANRPGLAVAKWHTESRTDELHLQIFQVALVEPGLLEAIVLSIILLQSGQSFGDTILPTASLGPNYFDAGSYSLSYCNPFHC